MVPSQLSLLQAEQAQLPQLSVLREMLPSPDHLCSPIDVLKYLKFSWKYTSNSYLLRKKTKPKALKILLAQR